MPSELSEKDKTWYLTVWILISPPCCLVATNLAWKDLETAMLTQYSSFLLNAFLIRCMLIQLIRVLQWNQSSQCVRLLFCSSSTAPHKSVQHPMASETHCMLSLCTILLKPIFGLQLNNNPLQQTPHHLYMMGVWCEKGIVEKFQIQSSRVL